MTDPTIQELFARGEQAFRAGRAGEAEAAYRQILAKRPEDPDATGNLGTALLVQGRLDEAIAALEQALVLRPHFPGIRPNLGAALRALGRLDAAIAVLEAAVAEAPTPGAFSNLGAALADRGRAAEAVAALDRSLALRPDHPETLSNLGSALEACGCGPEALAAWRRALALRPDFPEALANLGRALKARGDAAEAVAALQRAATLRPMDPEILSSLGAALLDWHEPAAAEAALARAVALRPGLAEAWSNLGVARHAQGATQDAAAAQRRALALKPGWPEARYNLGLALLRGGDWGQGWAEAEHRLGTAVPLPILYQRAPERIWAGGPVAGKRILLTAEQGLGDTIQFARYAPLLAERGASVTVSAPPALGRLFRTLRGVSVAGPGEVPDFDLHCTLMSLPHRFATLPGTVPAGPYLAAEPALVEAWRGRLEAMSPDPAVRRIGLVWAGSATQRNDVNRSMPLARLLRLADLPGIRLFSLQKELRAGDAALLGDRILPLGDRLDDLAETAAAIAALDLVVTVDTSVAHLAGALGRPVMVLLCHAPDWRWLDGQDRSPWYPSMRIFRQTAPGDWDGVVGRLASAFAAGEL